VLGADPVEGGKAVGGKERVRFHREPS
jgi:hypothetical protein